MAEGGGTYQVARNTSTMTPFYVARKNVLSVDAPGAVGLQLGGEGILSQLIKQADCVM